MATKRSSSKGVPVGVLEKLRQRLTAHAAAKWPACKAVAVRSRGAFAYVDVQAPEYAQLEPMFRLRFLGDADVWEFAYFSWAHEAYEPSFLANGSPIGSPEECFDTAAFSILSG